LDAGTTFVLKDKAVDGHLWVIVSDPGLDAAKVLFVSLTTYTDYKEDVCLVRVGDHPWVRHLSCIAYDFAKVTTLDKLNALKDKGHLELQPPVSAELLKRIRQAAMASTRLAIDYYSILEDQGLLEFDD
jgi:hypothetical protein